MYREHRQRNGLQNIWAANWVGRNEYNKIYAPLNLYGSVLGKVALLGRLHNLVGLVYPMTFLSKYYGIKCLVPCGNSVCKSQIPLLALSYCPLCHHSDRLRGLFLRNVLQVKSFFRKVQLPRNPIQTYFDTK